MYESNLATESSMALLRAMQHWHQPAEGEKAESESRLPTIALSREVGSGGSLVARELATKLGWPVYDNELLERIAHDMKLRVKLLESVDEKHIDWLQECLQSFASGPAVSEQSYVRHLHETLFSLGSHGACVIVGRGAAQVLPAATTLRVRVVAALADRVQSISRELGLTVQQAARHIEAIDRERVRFIQEHFQKDPRDPLGYDLVLNGSRFTVSDCADLILEALRRHKSMTAPARALAMP